MKKLLYRVLPILAMLLLASAYIGTGSALADSCTNGANNCTTTSTQSQSVNTGTFTENVVFTQPAPLTLSTVDQTTTETIDAKVTDENGDNLGFTLQITADPFIGAGTHDVLLPMHLTPDGTSNEIPGAGTYHYTPTTATYTSAYIADNTAGANNTFTYFVSAQGSGLGQFNIPATGTITVKSNNLADTYNSNQTVLLIDGAPF